MPSRFRFQGHAIGAGGRIRSPFQEIIEIQAATALPEIGGYGSGRKEKFAYREILSFDLAHSEVTGSISRADGTDVHNTLIKTTVEGLNIMGMVTADRVVANLVSVNRGAANGEPSINLTGSRYENLKIAGVPVKVDLALDVFNRLDTHTAVREAYRGDREFRALFDKITLRERLAAAPARVQRWFHRPPGEDGEMPDTRGFTSLSLVRGMEPERPATDTWGHVIYLEGFGTIRLAELQLSKFTRRLTMLEVTLGSPVDGDVTVGAVDDGGTDW